MLWQQAVLLFAVLLVLSAATLLCFRSRRSVAFYLAGAVLGPLAESFPIASGAWTYGGTDALFPLWLPPAWGLGCLLLVVIVEHALPTAPDEATPAP